MNNSKIFLAWKSLFKKRKKNKAGVRGTGVWGTSRCTLQHNRFYCFFYVWMNNSKIFLAWKSLVQKKKRKINKAGVRRTGVWGTSRCMRWKVSHIDCMAQWASSELSHLPIHTQPNFLPQVLRQSWKQSFESTKGSTSSYCNCFLFLSFFFFPLFSFFFLSASFFLFPLSPPPPYSEGCEGPRGARPCARALWEVRFRVWVILGW